MFDSFEAARVALVRDGWKRYTSYWFRKMAGDRWTWLELQWNTNRSTLVPIMRDADEPDERTNMRRRAVETTANNILRDVCPAPSSHPDDYRNSLATLVADLPELSAKQLGRLAEALYSARQLGYLAGERDHKRTI